MIACLVAAPWPYPTARNAPGAEGRSLFSNTNSTRHILRHPPDTEPYPSCGRDKSFSAFKEMNRFHRVATLPEQLAQVAIRANFLADRLAHFQQCDRIIDHKIYDAFQTPGDGCRVPASQFRGGMAKLRSLRTTCLFDCFG